MKLAAVVFVLLESLSFASGRALYKRDATPASITGLQSYSGSGCPDGSVTYDGSNPNNVQVGLSGFSLTGPSSLQCSMTFTVEYFTNTPNDTIGFVWSGRSSIPSAANAEVDWTSTLGLDSTTRSGTLVAFPQSSTPPGEYNWSLSTGFDQFSIQLSSDTQSTVTMAWTFSLPSGANSGDTSVLYNLGVTSNLIPDDE